MDLIEELSRQRQLYARCPRCDCEFRLSEARLFDATKKLPSYAIEHLNEQRDGLREGRRELAKRKQQAASRPRIAAESIGIGKIVEKIAPSLRGFPVASADCRSLLEPIDYIVFRGLSTVGRVEAIYFVDVKTGQARLSKTQKQVRKLVEGGKVRLLITDHRDTEAR